MDWYYPVLSGILAGPSGALRLNRGWQDFVMEGLGVRCVSDRPWVTAAETAECAMAVGAAGMVGKGRRMLGWTRHLRGEDGSYWTGCVHPECVRFPGGERSTYTAAAVLMADHVLHSDAPSASVFSSAESPGLVYLVDDLPGDPPLPALEP